MPVFLRAAFPPPPVLLLISTTSDHSSGRRPTTLLWGAIWAFFTVGLAMVGADTAMHFNESPIDGPFQLYNALRRILDGQRIGADFQFFHGPAVPYLHYPFFALFGHTFAASELSRQVTSALLFGFAYLAVFAAFTRSWRRGFMLATVAIAASIAHLLLPLFFPVNSLLGVRSTMPLVLAGGLALIDHGRWRAPAIGAGLALGLALGTEHGMAMIAAFVVVSVATALRSGAWRPVAVEVAVSIGVMMLAYVAIVLALGGFAGLAGVWRYNFGAVPADQFWYFGGPPNRFLHLWSQLLSLYGVPMRLLVILVTFGITQRVFFRGDRTITRAQHAKAFLGAYALLSIAPILGTYVTVYLYPAMRVVIVLALLGLVGLRDHPPAGISRFTREFLTMRGALAVVLSIVVLAGLRFGTIRAMARAPLHFSFAHLQMGIPQELSPDWQAARAEGLRQVAAIQPAGGATPVIWSTYSTITEATVGAFHPSFDYIIHALGPENRRQYVADFTSAKPDLAQTLRPRYSVYEEWLAGHHWDFYRALFRDYEIAGRSRWTFWWTRRATPFEEQARVIADATLTDQNALSLAFGGDSTDLSLLEVQLEYEIVNPWRHVPVVKNLPRYLVHVRNAGNRNAISLPPYASVVRFPVVARGQRSVELIPEVASLVPGASLRFTRVRLTLLQVSPGTMPWVTEFAGPRQQPNWVD